jgi:5'-nucleotidase
VTNQNGNQVLVVQASAYTKYLGNLTVFFDDSGNVVDWNGAPIFLGPKIPTGVNMFGLKFVPTLDVTDEDIDADLSVWKKAVDLEGSKIVGSSMFTMPKQPCREEECPLGNFATDAMVSSVRLFITFLCPPLNLSF